MADAQFAIEIAAEMGGGEHTIAELDEMVSAFTGAGKNASAFQDAIKQLSTSLDTARVAQAAANDALSAGKAEYSRLEQAALQAAKAAEKIARSGTADEVEQAAQKAKAAEAAVNAYASELKALEANSAKATEEQEHLAQTFANVKKLGAHADKVIAQNAEKLSKFGGALGAVGGPLGSLGQKLSAPVKGFRELEGVMGSSNAAALLAVVGFAAVAAAVVAVTAAVVAGTVKIAAWAVGLADSARSAGLATEAFDAMNPGVAALRGNITALEKETGLSSTSLNGIAKGLLDAGESADAMADSLHVAALAEKALGAGGAAAYTQLVKAAADATNEAEAAAKKMGSVPEELKRKVDDTTAAVETFSRRAKTELGGVVAKQMRGLDAQSERLKKGFNELFSGLNIEPVLNAMTILVDLFDKNTAAGETMKFLFETIFQPLIDQAENAMLVVEAFFLGFLIGAVKLYIALKPTIQALGEFFGFDDTSLTDTLTSVKEIGELIAPVILFIAAAFTAAVAVVTLFVGAIAALGAALVGLPVIMLKIGEAMVSLGGDLVRGLANGITNAGGAVLSAITGVVSGAINAAKSLLGIASPSKVFEEIGGFTGEGMTTGVEDSAVDVQGAFTEMVSPDAAAQSAGASGAPSGGGASKDFSGAVFNFYGVAGAEQAVKSFREMLLMTDEELALMAGAGEAAA